ncbi:MAG TPA: hypothetical protein VJH04_01190 [archaeon]|nr:hypothetical protein [archaeon]
MEPILRKMSKDMDIIKNELYELREEIDSLKLVKPGYLKKIKNIEKNGKFKTFSDINDLRKSIENV